MEHRLRPRPQVQGKNSSPGVDLHPTWLRTEEARLAGEGPGLCRGEVMNVEDPRWITRLVLVALAVAILCFAG